MTREAPCKLAAAHRLPPSIVPVGELIGERPLLRLIEAYGGRRLYVPVRVAQFEPLATLLGLKPAQRLARAYAREYITVPLCKAWRMEMLRAQGLTYAAIALRLGMHEQSVFRALHQHEDHRKPDQAAQLRLQLD